MTLEELYESIGGDYDKALRVLRVEKLVDKHIRKLATNEVVDGLIAAGETMEPKLLFESAHAAKGICANLGLTGLAALASDIAEEFRPENARTLSDEEVAAKLEELAALYEKTKAGIERYTAE